MVKKAVVNNETAEEREAVLSIYEAGYHILPTIKEEDLDGVVGKTRAIVEKSGGSLIAEGAPAIAKLAYSMFAHEAGKNTEYDRAYFGWLKFEAPRETAEAISAHFSSTPSFLRAVVFRTVREDTRAKIKTAPLREVKSSYALKTSARREEEVAAPVSEADLEKALEGITE